MYQGAYKVSKGLLQEFGEMRVVDTPITELGFAGVGVGAAMVGLRPDHRVHDVELRAARARPGRQRRREDALHVGRPVQRCRSCSAGRTARRCSCPRSTRRRSSRWLAHIPGLKVVHAGHAVRREGTAQERRFATTTRSCFLEGEMLYNTKGEVPEEEYIIPIGKAELKREGDHCSIITNGKMALVAMQVADQLAKEGIHVDVVDLRTVRPMDVEAIATSVQKTNRAVVLEEGWEICGIGAQVVDYIQRECFDDLDAPVLRVHQADVPMPYAKNLERAAKPDVGEDDRGGQAKSCTSTRSDYGDQSHSWRRSRRRWKKGASSNG